MERGDGQFTAGDLRERLAHADVCVTGWGTPTLDAGALPDADRPSLVAHVGGSVAAIASDALYDRGVSVCSANEVMAPFVAEGALAYALAALRDLPARDADIRAGGWPNERDRDQTLSGRRVGFVGLGSVGRERLPLLAPFDVDVGVYDPYVAADELGDAADEAGVDASTIEDLDALLADSEVVWIHASLTPETVGLVGVDRLSLLPEGALLVNTARGPIVDEPALVQEREAGRVRAALDVYDEEPLPDDNTLRECDAALLGPHVAGAPTGNRLADAVVTDVERFVRGEPLEREIPRERYERMTRLLSPEDG